MIINKKFAITTGLIGVIALCVSATLPQQQQQGPPKLVNLKVFPKNVPFRVLDHQMDIWADALGVHCNFCHVRDAQSGKMDFASDAKPEKTAARQMYVMMGKINKKFFKAEKDSLGMIITTGVNCNTCHHGTSHPEIKVPEEHRFGPGGPGPGGPPPGGGPGGPGPGGKN
ncbi:c-type cytochrome [Mucilaginibacter sp.]|uniref:c-type cytochrome n=1 Tax=Mucilaginibacter sp. TaxID=1882438 RepID=UPI00284A7D77|nr:c-type cytochrome [Mucilaginibacter sp.]MDR3697196.1 c-type cytochrome [Mucilaginibacter sp.]